MWREYRAFIGARLDLLSINHQEKLFMQSTTKKVFPTLSHSHTHSLAQSKLKSFSSCRKNHQHPSRDGAVLDVAKKKVHHIEWERERGVVIDSREVNMKPLKVNWATPLSEYSKGRNASS